MSSFSHHLAGRRLPPLNAVRTFEAAARHGSFLKAASELHVTPGAVSRLVKSLEDYLGVELFSRSHRALQLTREGCAFAGAATQALGQLANATEQLFLCNNRNVLRVCCHLTFAVHWLIPRWATFQSQYPEYQLDLHTDVSPESADVDAFDFVVRLASEPVGESHRVTDVRILDFDTFPVCSPALMARQGQFTRLEDLHGHQLIQSARRPGDWNRWLESAGFDGIDMPRVTTFESLTHAYSAAVSGSGIAIGIRAFVEGDLSSGRLVRLFNHVYRDTRGLNLMYNPAQARKSPKMRHFLEWVLAQCERDGSGTTTEVHLEHAASCS